VWSGNVCARQRGTIDNVSKSGNARSWTLEKLKSTGDGGGAGVSLMPEEREARVDVVLHWLDRDELEIAIEWGIVVDSMRSICTYGMREQVNVGERCAVRWSEEATNRALCGM
jgi:hypothetical protein